MKKIILQSCDVLIKNQTQSDKRPNNGCAITVLMNQSLEIERTRGEFQSIYLRKLRSENINTSL